MKPVKNLPKRNSKITKKVKQTTNDQSKNRTAYKNQIMIRRVVGDVTTHKKHR